MMVWELIQIFMTTLEIVFKLNGEMVGEMVNVDSMKQVLFLIMMIDDGGGD